MKARAPQNLGIPRGVAMQRAMEATAKAAAAGLDRAAIRSAMPQDDLDCNGSPMTRVAWHGVVTPSTKCHPWRCLGQFVAQEDYFRTSATCISVRSN